MQVIGPIESGCIGGPWENDRHQSSMMMMVINELSTLSHQQIS